MDFGIIGYGNIGSLISKNLEDIGFLDENNLNVSSRSLNKLENLSSNINIYEHNGNLAENSDVVFISVKSPDLIKVIEEIAPFMDNETYLVHSSAGISFDDIANVYDGEVSCVIPSIASEANPEKQKTGISIFHHNENVSDENRKMIEELFSRFSNVIVTDSYDDLEALTIATSCMPAFIAFATSLFAEELSKSSSLNYDDIYRYLNETNASTANLLNNGLFTSDEIIGKVTTKNGITQKGLDYLSMELPTILNNLIKNL